MRFPSSRAVTRLTWRPTASLLLSAALLASIKPMCWGQTPSPRTYLPNLADEDWRFLADETKREDFWDPVKYIPLGAEDRFLTLAAEIRFRPEGFRIRAVGDRPVARDGYLLQRYLFGADLHVNERLRVYAELQSGLISGRLNSPRPTDKNSVDLHQGFLEWKKAVPDERTFSVRAGRQELTIGSSRLISASPGLNVKRSFDGVVSAVARDAWRWEAGIAKLVSLSQGAFDDVPDHEQTFWAVAATRRILRLTRGHLGFYYLGLDRAVSVYAQGTGRERRHTLGVKWSGSRPRLDLNYDAILQWGQFAGATARGWAFSTETGYRISKRYWAPRVSIRADIASGDKDLARPELQSFNPLFPGNSYAGAVGLFGPTNVADLTPALTMVPHKRVVLVVESPNYWRTSVQDGIYSTDLRLLIGPGAGEGSYVGTNPGVAVTWQATRHIKVQGVITRFLSGSFLDETFVAEGFGFYSFSVIYRF